jgi:hypothetical protein
MVFLDAHEVSVNGIYSKDLIVFNIIDNRDSSNRIVENGVIYGGHGSKSLCLKSFNYLLTHTGALMIPFQFYVGPQSSHPSKNEKGYNLLGLFYVQEFHIKEYNRSKERATGFELVSQRKGKKTNAPYQWVFHISSEIYTTN